MQCTPPLKSVVVLALDNEPEPIGIDLVSRLRAVPEIILRESEPQALFCPVGGGCFVDVPEGWGGGG